MIDSMFNICLYILCISNFIITQNNNKLTNYKVTYTSNTYQKTFLQTSQKIALKNYLHRNQQKPQ